MSSAYVFTKPERLQPLPRLPLTLPLSNSSSPPAVVINRAADADLETCERAGQ